MLKDIFTIIAVLLFASAILAGGGVLLGRSRSGEPPTERVAKSNLYGDGDCETSDCTYIQNGGIVKLFDGFVECRLIGAEGWCKARSCLIQNMFDGKCTFQECSPPTTAARRP